MIYPLAVKLHPYEGTHNFLFNVNKISTVNHLGNLLNLLEFIFTPLLVFYHIKTKK
jgi:hypothetical protein